MSIVSCRPTNPGTGLAARGRRGPTGGLVPALAAVALGLAVLGCRGGGSVKPAASIPVSVTVTSSSAPPDLSVPRTATGANGNPRDDRLGPPAGSGPSDAMLAPGVCFDEFLVTVVDVTTHSRVTKPCDQPHDGETFAVLGLPGDLHAPFPGEAAAERLARSACLAGFDGYVGQEYAVSRLRIALLRPSGSTWATGDRTVVCTLYDQDLKPLTAPAQGSRL